MFKLVLMFDDEVVKTWEIEDDEFNTINRGQEIITEIKSMMDDVVKDEGM